GRAAALALVGAGFAVVGTSRNAANAEPLAGVTFLDLDVASDESVRSLVEEVIERFGRIDVLVNNAGVGAVGAGEESSINQAKEVFDINVFGVVRMTNAVLPACEFAEEVTWLDHEDDPVVPAVHQEHARRSARGTNRWDHRR